MGNLIIEIKNASALGSPMKLKTEKGKKLKNAHSKNAVVQQLNSELT